MYFAIMLFWITLISMVVLSKFTEEPEPYRVSEMIIILIYLNILNIYLYIL